MSEVKDYGEPWVIELGTRFVVNKSNDILFYTSLLEDMDRAERTVACVNALAGMNPEKLAALIEAAENVVFINSYPVELNDDAPKDVRDLHEVHALKDALKELRGEG